MDTEQRSHESEDPTPRSEVELAESTGAIERTDDIFKILRSLFRDEYDTYEAGRRYDIPFEVSPDDIVRLDEVARELIRESMQQVAGPDVEFSATLRYADLSSDRYLDLPSMLKNGGDRGDPERLAMVWSSLAPNPMGATISIEVTYVTEKPLDLEERVLGHQHNAWASVVVKGTNSDWARLASDRCGSYVKEQEIAGIYKPLHVFRQREVVFVVAFIVALLAQRWVTEFLAQASLDYDAINRRRAEFVDAVRSAPSVDVKLDRVISWQYSPLSPDDLLSSLRTQAAGALVFVLALVAVVWLLPKLVPRSFVAIGLSGKRFRRHRTLFNFLVFSVCVVGVIVPLSVEVIS